MILGHVIRLDPTVKQDQVTTTPSAMTEEELGRVDAFTSNPTIQRLANEVRRLRALLDTGGAEPLSVKVVGSTSHADGSETVEWYGIDSELPGDHDVAQILCDTATLCRRLLATVAALRSASAPSGGT